MHDPATGSSDPYAPVQLYILLTITLATLAWLWPKDRRGATVSSGRLAACCVLVLLEVAHLIVSNVVEVPGRIGVNAHVFLLLAYVAVMSEMLYNFQQNRAAAPPPTDWDED